MPTPHRFKVLVAVKPAAMARVIEHLFRGQPQLEVLEYRSAGSHLAEHAETANVELIVASTRLLGRSRWETLAAVKRSSPGSKLIVICPLGGFTKEARESGADACLEEEAVVSGLLDTVRRLTEA